MEKKTRAKLFIGPVAVGLLAGGAAPATAAANIQVPAKATVASASKVSKAKQDDAIPGQDVATTAPAIELPTAPPQPQGTENSVAEEVKIAPQVGRAATPTATPVASVTGTAQVGQVLTANPSGSSTTGPAGYSYQWLRNGAKISGATAKTYNLVAADVGTRISVRITQGTGGVLGQEVTSSQTAAVQAAVSQFAGGAASISGSSAKVGVVLTANPSGFSPAPTSYTYQWLRSGAVISGATAKTYTPTTADVGKTIAVKITAVRSGYTSKTVQSGATPVVVAATLQFTGGAASISGSSAKVGVVLTANPSGFSPAPTSYTYQWLRSGAVISGATAKTYTPTTADVGKTIVVKITAVRSGYTSKTVQSGATAAIAAAATQPPASSATGTWNNPLKFGTTYPIYNKNGTQIGQLMVSRPTQDNRNLSGSSSWDSWFASNDEFIFNFSHTGLDSAGRVRLEFRDVNGKNLTKSCSPGKGTGTLDLAYKTGCIAVPKNASGKFAVYNLSTGQYSYFG